MATVVRRKTGRVSENIGRALGLAGAVGLQRSDERKEKEEEQAKIQLMTDLRRDVVKATSREEAIALSTNQKYAQLFEDFDDDKMFGEIIDVFHPEFDKGDSTDVSFYRTLDGKNEEASFSLTPEQRQRIQDRSASLATLFGRPELKDFSLIKPSSDSKAEKPSIVVVDKEGKPIPGLQTAAGANKIISLNPGYSTLKTQTSMLANIRTRQEIAKAARDGGTGDSDSKAAEIEGARGVLDILQVPLNPGNMRRAVRWNRVETINDKAFRTAFNISDTAEFDTLTGTNKGERMQAAQGAYVAIRNEALRSGTSITPSEAQGIAIKVARNLIPEVRLGLTEQDKIGKEGDRNPPIVVSLEESKAGVKTKGGKPEKLIPGDIILVALIEKLPDVKTTLFYIGSFNGEPHYLPL